MAKHIKTIGVMTSGGDAPGMNAALRGVVRTAIYNKIRVLGIKKGYAGLIEDNITELNTNDVSDILQRGGTILQTARCPEMMTEEGVLQASETAKRHGMDALVVIGGDGSFRGALELSKYGLNVIGIPATIDNDIGCSDYTIGYDTAMNTAIDAIDKIRDTASSHERCSVIEVMGRRAGYIAAPVGLACGAECILTPEWDYDFDKDIIENIYLGRKKGKSHFLIVAAEGKVSAQELATKIEEKTGIRATASVLGYIQRGGKPSLRDRLIATEMGYEAVNLLLEGKTSRVIAVKNGKICDIDIKEGLEMKKNMDLEFLDIAYAMSRHSEV